MTNGPDGGLPPAPPLSDRRNGGQPADDPLVPQDFSAWMAKIVDAFGRSWRLVGLLQLLLNLSLAVALVLFHEVAGPRLTVGSNASLHFRHPGAALGLGALLLVIALVFGAMVQLGSLWVIVRQADGGPVALGPALRFALSRVLPVIGWEVLAGIMVGLGIVLFIVPGVLLGVVLIPTLLGVVGLERRGMRRCFELAGGSFLALFGRCCAAVLIGLAYTRLVQVVVNAIFGSGDGWGPQISSGLLQLPLDVAGIAFLVVTYAELRGRKSRTTTRELATALDA